MARRRRGGRRSGWQKWVRRAVSLTFKGVGAYVALSPIVESAMVYVPAKDFGGFGRDLQRRYATVENAPDSYGRALAGIVIAWVGGQIARRF